MLARENFGCGSSREHALWALKDFGFRALIAPSFADIFRANCIQNGLLPIVLDTRVVDELFRATWAHPGYRLTVDLRAGRLERAAGEPLAFSIDPYDRRRLLEGLDEIALTLRHSAAIRAYEAARREAAPWLFPGSGPAS